MRFLVTGGLQRADAVKLGEGRRFHTAVLNRLDWDSDEVECLLKIERGNDHYPDTTPNLLYTAASIVADRLYLCTETELFVFDYPSLELVNECSLPHFHNIHHVTFCKGHVAVASTGLDLVILLDPETLAPVHFYHALGKDPWHRFSRDVDYRKVHSTKPHDSHPNFVFEINGEVWATRFNQKDAVCLDDMNKRIDIGIERVHDGHVVGDHVYFTTVNGKIVIASTSTLRVDEIIDLNELEDTEAPLGWCRGLAIRGDRIYVGFSRIRRTPFKENLNWMLDYVGAREIFDTRIVEYDIRSRKKIHERVLSQSVSDVIYSVIDENPA